MAHILKILADLADSIIFMLFLIKMIYAAELILKLIIAVLNRLFKNMIIFALLYLILELSRIYSQAFDLTP